MKTKRLTETARAVAVLPDDGRHAARLVMLSTLFLFTVILVLQAIAP